MQLAVRPWLAAGQVLAGDPSVRGWTPSTPRPPLPLADYFFEAPGAASQQLVVNQLGHLDELFDYPTNVDSVLLTISTTLHDVSQLATLNASTGRRCAPFQLGNPLRKSLYQGGGCD